MTTASAVDITPQFYTVDDIAAILRKDFADRGTIATVDVDEWGPEKMRGSPQVILAYEDGEFTEPAGHYQPGVNLEIRDPALVIPGTTGRQARAILDDVQNYVLRIHAPRVGQAETTAAGARRATDQLMRQTLRAIRRAMAGPLRKAGRIEWPKRSDPDVLGYEGFVYGSLCRVFFPIASPIADDAYGVGTVTEIQTNGALSLDGGSTFSTILDSYLQPVPPS